MRLWISCLALLAAACQPVSAPPPAPQGPQTPSMAVPAPSAAPYLPGERLVPGQKLSFAVMPEQAARVMLANPSRTEAQLQVQVQPPGAPAASPSPTPDRETPPFGFGFGAREGGWGIGTGDRAARSGQPRVLAAGAGPQVGKSLPFWINDGSTSLEGDKLRTATVRLVTPHAIFMVDKADAQALEEEEIKRLADAFETRIRPPLVRVFGEEPDAGIDGEKRLFIVLSSHVGSAPGRSGMMGYFWPRDPVPKGGTGADARQHANEKEVIFLNSEVVRQPEITGLGTLAHEYQHLLMFLGKTAIDGVPRTEDTWLDEGLSMLAMDLAGFGLAGGDRFAAQEIADFQRDPGAYSLTDWRGNPNGHSYGLSYLFCRYLVDRFGLSIVKQIYATPKTGTEAMDEVLRDRGTTLASTFVDWAIANRPKDETTSDFRSYAWFDPFGTYGGVQLSGVAAERLTEAASAKVRPWGVRYLEVEGLAGVPRALILEAASAPLVVMQAQRKEEGLW